MRASNEMFRITDFKNPIQCLVLPFLIHENDAFSFSRQYQTPLPAAESFQLRTPKSRLFVTTFRSPWPSPRCSVSCRSAIPQCTGAGTPHSPAPGRRSEGQAPPMASAMLFPRTSGLCSLRMEPVAFITSSPTRSLCSLTPLINGSLSQGSATISFFYRCFIIKSSVPTRQCV